MQLQLQELRKATAGFTKLMSSELGPSLAYRIAEYTVGLNKKTKPMANIESDLQKAFAEKTKTIQQSEAPDEEKEQQLREASAKFQEDMNELYETEVEVEEFEISIEDLEKYDVRLTGQEMNGLRPWIKAPN